MEIIVYVYFSAKRSSNFKVLKPPATTEDQFRPAKSLFFIHRDPISS